MEENFSSQLYRKLKYKIVVKLVLYSTYHLVWLYGYYNISALVVQTFLPAARKDGILNRH